MPSLDSSKYYLTGLSVNLITLVENCLERPGIITRFGPQVNFLGSKRMIKLVESHLCQHLR